MEVGFAVVDTIRYIRVMNCSHNFKKYSDTEKQCSNCDVICTPEGEENLKQMSRKFK